MHAYRDQQMEYIINYKQHVRTYSSEDYLMIE